MIYSSSDFYHKIYTESCDEFEKVRWECLLEKNWLDNNYKPNRFNIEDYDGVSVVYNKHNHEPFAFAGLYTNGYPAGVAQVAKRMYGFQKYYAKSHRQLVVNWEVVRDHIINPLEEVTPYQFGFIGMQNRSKKKTKGYFEQFARAGIRAMPEWKVGEGYINACGSNPHPTCWQNYMYCGDINIWNPEIITHEKWIAL